MNSINICDYLRFSHSVFACVTLKPFEVSRAENGKMLRMCSLSCLGILILSSFTSTVRTAEDLFKVLSYNTWGTGGNVSSILKTKLYFSDFISLKQTRRMIKWLPKVLERAVDEMGYDAIMLQELWWQGGLFLIKSYIFKLLKHFLLSGQHEAARRAMLSLGFTMPEFAKMNETKCPANGCSGEKCCIFCNSILYN